MRVKGSRAAPKRLFMRRAPFATARTSPALRVRQTAMRSASARLYVRSTIASVLTNAMPRPQVIFRTLRSTSTQRQKIKDPTKDKSNEQKLTKYLKSVDQPLTVGAFRHYTENNPSQACEHRHPKDVSHCFLPAAISKASS